MIVHDPGVGLSRRGDIALTDRPHTGRTIIVRESVICSAPVAVLSSGIALYPRQAEGAWRGSMEPEAFTLVAPGWHRN